MSGITNLQYPKPKRYKISCVYIYIYALQQNFSNFFRSGYMFYNGVVNKNVEKKYICKKKLTRKNNFMIKVQIAKNLGLFFCKIYQT